MMHPDEARRKDEEARKLDELHRDAKSQVVPKSQQRLATPGMNRHQRRRMMAILRKALGALLLTVGVARSEEFTTKDITGLPTRAVSLLSAAEDASIKPGDCFKMTASATATKVPCPVEKPWTVVQPLSENVSLVATCDPKGH